jgi:primosomal replication protein N
MMELEKIKEQIVTVGDDIRKVGFISTHTHSVEVSDYIAK